MAAVGVVTLVSYSLARTVSGRGVLLPWALPGLLGAALALVLTPTRAPGVAPNALTSTGWRDPYAGTPWHKHVPARIEPASAPV